MKVETVSRDCGLSIDEAQEALDQNQVEYDRGTGRYYLKPRRFPFQLDSQINNLK